MKAKFYLHRDDCGHPKVVCMTKYKGKLFFKSLGIRWEPSNWDMERQRPVPRTINEDGVSAAALAARIDSIEQIINDILDEVKEKSIDQFKKLFRLALDSQSQDKESLLDVSGEVVLEMFDEFLEHGKKFRRWSDNTLQNYLVLRRHLKLYDGNLVVSDLNFMGLVGFHAYLVKAGLADSAIHDYFKCLMSFLRWLDGAGGKPDPSYKEFSFKTRWNTGDVVYLTVDELASISSLDIPPDGTVFRNGDFKCIIENANDLIAARDMFLFCCTTGLRFSDMQSLVWKNVLEDELCIVARKTGKKTEIELNGVSSAILDKYRRKEEGRVFPECSNFYMNVLLKKIARMAGITSPVTRVTFNKEGRRETTEPKWKRITTHTGRHTFIANALSMGIPSQVVMSWTGHSDESTMRPYVAFTNPAKRRAMTKLELFLDSFLKKN